MSRLPRAILMLVMLGLARAGGATPADRPVSLELQDADVHGVLRLLAEVGGFDVAVGEGVKGKVTLRLDRVDIYEAASFRLMYRLPAPSMPSRLRTSGWTSPNQPITISPCAISPATPGCR